MLKFAVITESDIFGVKKKKKKKSRYQGQRISDFAQLKPGDYVVHENYGLGIYRGTERQIVDKVTKDYIKIEYGDGGKLYFPVTQLHMIQKYADSESKQPKLNKLNGQEWTKTKAVFKKQSTTLQRSLWSFMQCARVVTAISMEQTLYGRKNLKSLYHLMRQQISLQQLMRQKLIWKARKSWTA